MKAFLAWLGSSVCLWEKGAGVNCCVWLSLWPDFIKQLGWSDSCEADK